MAREYFCFFHAYGKKTERLTDAQMGRLVRALVAFSETGERQELDAMELMAFDFIASDIESTKAKYEKSCESHAEAGKKGGRPKKEKCDSENQKNQTKANGLTESKTQQTETKTETKTETNTKTKECGRFIAPTVEEVKAYCTERRNHVLPERFVAYYTANGWKVGKTPMKDWKAAVRSWEKNGYNDQKPQPATPASYDIDRAEQKARTTVPTLRKDPRKQKEKSSSTI